MTKQQIALARALPILIFTIIFATIIALLSLRVIRQTNESETINYSTLAPVCNGEAISHVLPYKEDESGIKPIIAFRLTNGGWVADTTAVPVSWQASSVEQTVLVLCMVDTQEFTLPLCDNVEQTQLIGYRTEIGLVAAESGRVLNQLIIEPTIPNGTCWDATNDQPSSTQQDQLQSWLQPYVITP